MDHFYTFRGMVQAAEETMVKLRKIALLAEELDAVWNREAAKELPGELATLARAAGVRSAEQRAEAMCQAFATIAENVVPLGSAAYLIEKAATQIRDHANTLANQRRAALRQREPI